MGSLTEAFMPLSVMAQSWFSHECIFYLSYLNSKISHNSHNSLNEKRNAKGWICGWTCGWIRLNWPHRFVAIQSGMTVMTVMPKTDIQRFRKNFTMTENHDCDRFTMTEGGKVMGSSVKLPTGQERFGGTIGTKFNQKKVKTHES